MYQVGDLIFYGNTGVCEVKGITTRDAGKANDKELYYVLEPVYQNCKIFIPVNTTEVFMRPVISKDEAKQLIDTIPTLQVETYEDYTSSQLTECYESLIKTHDCADLIELTMSIYTKKQLAEQKKHKFGAIDDKFMKRAEELLFGELAIALDIPKEKVPEYIAKRVSRKNRANKNEYN